MSEITQTFAASGPDNKPTVFNSGVSRILGTNLPALGKKINWLYLIQDIMCLAVFENQGNDIWLGANGIPVAGNTQVLESLIPFEGQRFYNIQTSQALEFKGGAWGGVTISAYQPLSPTTLIINAPTELTVQRDHLVVASTVELVLQDVQRSNGSHLRVTTLQGLTDVTLVATGADLLVDTFGNVVTEVPLVGGIVYDVYYYEGTWYVAGLVQDLDFLRPGNNLLDVEDVDTARFNLNVLSVEETADLADSINSADSSLVFQGTTYEATRTARVNFATAQEFVDGITGKAVDPATVRNFTTDAIQAALGASEFNNITGITGTDSVGFSLTASDSTTLAHTAFSVVFNTEPYLRTQSLISLDLAAGSVAIPASPGRIFYYVVLDVLGVISFLTSYDKGNPLLLRLGYCLADGGNIVSLVTVPQLASSDKSLRTQDAIVTGGQVGPTAIGLAAQLKSDVALWNFEGSNWAYQEAKPHIRTRAELDVLTFNTITDDGTIVGSGNSYVDGRLLQDGSSVAALEYSVQVVYEDITGIVYLLLGTDSYATIEEAVTAALSSSFPTPSYLKIYKELSRLVVRGDQFEGSASADLTDNTKFRSLSLATVGGTQTDAAGVEWRITTGGGLLQGDVNYLVKDAGTYTLPPLTPSTSFVGVKAAYNVEPTVQVSNVGTESITDEFNGDLSTTLSFDVGGHKAEFISDVTTWRF